MSVLNQILAILEKKKGEYISGESAAQELCVSRNAIWKAISDLKSSGYEIEASTKKGYRLLLESDILSREAMLPYLPGAYNPDLILIFDELDSTSIRAKKLAASGAAHGTAVIAKKQTGGIGRYGRSFFSPDGGLYISMVLDPAMLGSKNPTIITSAAAVITSVAIEKVFNVKPSIKWVNDLLLNNKKICGILTEAVTDLESGTIGWLVLGIGVNVNIKDIPQELCDIIGSIDPNSNVHSAKIRLACEIIKGVLSFCSNPKAFSLFDEYKTRLSMLGKNVTVYQTAESYEAEAIDIDDDMHLLVKRSDGEIITLSSGEVSVKQH